MDNKKYDEIVKKHTKNNNSLKNCIIAFIVGGFMGMLGNFLIEVYSFYFNLSSKDASVFMIITLIFLGCFLTCLGFFDKFVNFCKCGLIIPITGFAHAMMSSALEYRKEGLVTGIGANMFKLAGSVIIFGVVSAYLFGILRIFLMGG